MCPWSRHGHWGVAGHMVGRRSDWMITVVPSALKMHHQSQQHCTHVYQPRKWHTGNNKYLRWRQFQLREARNDRNNGKSQTGHIGNNWFFSFPLPSHPWSYSSWWEVEDKAFIRKDKKMQWAATMSQSPQCSSNSDQFAIIYCSLPPQGQQMQFSKFILRLKRLRDLFDLRRKTATLISLVVWWFLSWARLCGNGNPLVLCLCQIAAW